MEEQQLIQQASETFFRRKSIHQAVVSNPDARRQAGNSNHAPFSPIAKGGNGAKNYQDMVLTFLEPTVWDMQAPTAPKEDGFMRAHPTTSQRCKKDGEWLDMIVFAKQKQLKTVRYMYLGTYQFETDALDGGLLIGELDDFTPYKPDSAEGKLLLKKLCSEKKNPRSLDEAKEWLEDPSKWRSQCLRNVDFDAELFTTLKEMEERNARR